MVDLIEKIGRFFAEQEAQIQERFSQVAYPVVSKSSSWNAKPLSSNHSVRTSEVNRESFAANSSLMKTRRNNFINRQRRSRVDSVMEPFYSFPVYSPNNDKKSDQLQDNFISRRSFSSLSSCPVSSRVSSRKDESEASHTSSILHERPRKPRHIHQKHRKRKKKRAINHSDKHSDPKAEAKANVAKIAAAIALAQERAKRIHQEKLQLEREQEMERQEAAIRLQKQMAKIEAVRAKSFCHSTTSNPTCSNGSSENQNDGWGIDPRFGTEKTSSAFMTELETHLREKMSLHMHLKQSYTRKSRQRERICQKFDKIVEENAVQSAKVARLLATKATLEMELSEVLEETAQIRQRRRDVELADEQERLKRHREAERLLTNRLREEEWSSIMKEEKERSIIAAKARVKASKRVEAHLANLRKLMQTYRYESRYSSGDALSSSRSNNNHSDHSNNDSWVPEERAQIKKRGHCNSSREQKSNEIDNNDTSERSPKNAKETNMSLEWQVPNFPDPTICTKLLMDLISDDEDEPSSDPKHVSHEKDDSY
ncbi:hypothetical protein Plhal304r1_c055g0140631 [Plasmopara halstedii]